jgi:glycosyltransferase involved in cell wall biosynthesis
VAEGGVRETVTHGKTGLLTARDPRAFADAIQALLENRDLRESLGSAGRAHVLERWTWDRTAIEVERSLEQLAGLDDSGAIPATEPAVAS